MKDHNSYQNPEKLSKPSLYPFSPLLKTKLECQSNQSHEKLQKQHFKQSPYLPYKNSSYERQNSHPNTYFDPYLHSLNRNISKQSLLREEDSKNTLIKQQSLRAQNDSPKQSQSIKMQKIQIFKTVSSVKYLGTQDSRKRFNKINLQNNSKQEEMKIHTDRNQRVSERQTDSPTFSPTYPKNILQWSSKKRKSKKSDEFGSIKKEISKDNIIEIIPVQNGKSINIVSPNIGNQTNRVRRLSNNQYLTTNNVASLNSPVSQSNSSPKVQSKIIKRDYSYNNLNINREIKTNIPSPFSYSQKNQSYKTRYFQIPTEPDTPGSQNETSNQPKNLIKNKSFLSTKLKSKPLSIQDFYVSKKPVGKGRFGNVYVVKNKQIGFVCAMKVMSKKTIIEEDFINQFCRQVTIQMYLKHCHIVSLYGMFDDSQNVYLLMQLCMDGQLYKYMKTHKPMEQYDSINTIKQICLGIEYLHRQNIIHRDLKPQNIIMHQNLIKICDFGWAVYNKDNMRDTFCGTPLFLSPEMLKGQNYSQKIDNWAIGMIIYEMMVGRPAFKIQTQKELEKIINQQIQFPQYSNISDLAKEFILRLLQKDQNKRMEIEEALNHPFITQS